MTEIFLIPIAIVIGVLISFKSDQQSEIILKGKLHRIGRKQELARPTYRKHLNRSSRALFASGMGVAAAAIIAREMPTVAICLGAVALLLCALGIWGSLKAFMAADEELKG